jgi:uncharacterized membrane protein HdeD (DUF308 family)
MTRESDGAGPQDPRPQNPVPPSEPSPDPAYQGARPASFADVQEPWSFGGGISAAMSARLAQNWWAIALRGVFAILFGLIAVFLPGVTLASLVLLFGVYMLVDGIFDIVAGIRAAARHERWGMLVFEGIVDLIAGAIAFVWPLATVLAFVILMAAWAIISGALLLSACFRLHPAHGRWLMGFGGVVSIIWGLLLFVFPIAGAVVLTLWMGAYALIFGVTLLVLAFRLRSRRQDYGRMGPLSQSA